MKNYKFSGSLRVFGGNVEHQAICEALGVTPKWLYRAGTPRVSPTGKLLGGVYASDYCAIDLAIGSDLSLPDFIDQQVRALLIHKELFEKIKKSSGRIEIFIGWFGDGNFGETFQADTLMCIGDLGVDLSLDIYPVDSIENQSKEL
jgi:hypothetical protein